MAVLVQSFGWRVGILVLFVCGSILYLSKTMYFPQSSRSTVKKNVRIYPAETSSASSSGERLIDSKSEDVLFKHSLTTKQSAPSAAAPYYTSTDAAESDRIYSRNLSEYGSVKVAFDPYSLDTMVYVHIQKTGGSEFLEHLVTAQFPLERIKSVRSVNTAFELPTDPDTQLVPLCKTSKIGGWKRETDYIHHEMCPRDWNHPNKDTWLISEKTTAWNCGVHAFYMDFKRCLSNSSIFNVNAKRRYREGGSGLLSDKSRFHYVVLLRHPILRYVSEYLHVLRGACWKREYVCDGEVMHQREPPLFGCPDHFQCNADRVKEFLQNVTLEKFAKCQDSWSTNRMTISLADHDEATCWSKTRYTHQERDRILLESAKSNLLRFSYFGIADFPSESSKLFEKTFGVVLKDPLKAMLPMNSKGGQFLESLSLNKDTLQLIVDNNRLDLQLYRYALEIFKKRAVSVGLALDHDTLNYIDKLDYDIA